MSYFGIAICALIITHTSICCAATCAKGVQSNGQTIEFSGILHQEIRWGPPNFGENPQTDSQFTVWIVSVSNPIVVQGGVEIGGKSQSSVSEIQLSIDPTTFRADSLQPLVGKLIVATGRLWAGTSQGDVTPVVLGVENVASANQAICRIVSDLKE